MYKKSRYIKKLRIYFHIKNQININHELELKHVHMYEEACE
jgi:hypothetical protein